MPPPGSVLTIHILPGRVTLSDDIDPKSCVEFAATNMQVAGVLVSGAPAAALSYSTVAGVLDATPSSTISKTTSIGAVTPPALPNPCTTPSTMQ